MKRFLDFLYALCGAVLSVMTMIGLLWLLAKVY